MVLPEDEFQGLNKNNNDSHLSVYEIQIALKDKIMNYKGGKEGVWKAIDPRFKIEKSDNIGQLGEGHDRIKKDTFIKSVDRLKVKNSTNEKMSFGLRGNFLLLMNVFEILGIKEFSDLTKKEFLKPNIEAVIHDTNTQVDELQKKLNIISETLDMLRMRKTRFPAIKVCRDWEFILCNLNSLTVNKPSQAGLTYLNNWLINNYDVNIQRAYYFFNILGAYKEYFIQDRLLHRFYKNIKYTSVYSFNDELIILSPLYILYFALLIHRKFLSIVLNYNYKLFLYVSLDEYGNKIKNEAVEKLTDGDVGKHLLKQNNDILNHLKNILTYVKNGNNLNQNDDLFGFLNKTINIFYNIYSSHADFSVIKLKELSESIKSIEDLNNKITLGNPNFYYISQAHIEGLAVINNDLDILESSINRLFV